jgi:hypothetical protein
LPDNICIHGFNVTIKNKTLKRRSSIVKHSRFLRNMEVTPIAPKLVESIQEINEGNEEEEDEDEN